VVWAGLRNFSLALAAAEAGIALALFVVLFRREARSMFRSGRTCARPISPPVIDESAGDEKTPEPAWPHLPVAGMLPEKSAVSHGHLERTGREPVSAVPAAKTGASHD